MTAFVANTNLVELIGLKSEVEGVYINDATLTCTIKTTAGVAVTGETWPVPMDYVAASNGNYRGVIADAVDLIAHTSYVAHIDVDAGPDRVGHWEFKFKALTRTGVN